jgi:hypothetical protein
MYGQRRLRIVSGMLRVRFRELAAS